MERHLTTDTVPDFAEPVAGPLYPDRCLECPELRSETYGNVKPLRCVNCVAADLRRMGRTSTRAPEENRH